MLINSLLVPSGQNTKLIFLFPILNNKFGVVIPALMLLFWRPFADSYERFSWFSKTRDLELDPESRTLKAESDESSLLVWHEWSDNMVCDVCKIKPNSSVNVSRRITHYKSTSDFVNVTMQYKVSIIKPLSTMIPQICLPTHECDGWSLLRWNDYRGGMICDVNY